MTFLVKTLESNIRNLLQNLLKYDICVNFRKNYQRLKIEYSEFLFEYIYWQRNYNPNFLQLLCKYLWNATLAIFLGFEKPWGTFELIFSFFFFCKNFSFNTRFNLEYQKRLKFFAIQMLVMRCCRHDRMVI